MWGTLPSTRPGYSCPAPYRFASQRSDESWLGGGGRGASQASACVCVRNKLPARTRTDICKGADLEYFNELKTSNRTMPRGCNDLAGSKR